MREGSTLDHIERMRNNMVYHVQRGLFDIAKIQTIAVLITFSLGSVLLQWLGMSQRYLPLRRSNWALRGSGMALQLPC